MGNPRALALLVTAALVVLVFLVLPGSVYMGNRTEFMTAPVPILRLLLAPALLLFVLALLGLRFSRRQDFSRYCSVVAALTLLVWAQAYVLVWDYGLLDGSPIDWSTAAWRGWVDLGIWLAGLGAAVALHRRLERPLATMALAVVALQAAAVAGSGFAHRDALKAKAADRYSAGDIDAMGRFSPERNVLHIVLDSFQADVFHELVTGPDGAELQSALPGFTFFEEHLGTFPATYLAMPVIISGQIYRNHIPQREFMEAAYSRGSILHAAHNAGFEVDVAADVWLLDLLAKGNIDHAYVPGGVPLVVEAAKLLDLALFRLSPHWVKPAVYNEQRWLTQRWLTRSDLLKFPYFTHNAFLTEITNRLAADRDKPVYKFFHLMTTHQPFVVNPDCSPAARVVPRVRETVTAQSRCGLAFVVTLLDRMKRAGIYDKSMIVLMADHGGHIDPYRYRTGHINLDGRLTELRAHDVAMAAPLLAIKPPGATTPFSISSAFTSMADVPATIDDLMQLGGGLPGRSIWDEARPQGERRYYIYGWRPTDPDYDYVEWIEEYVISGSVYQVESWHPVAAFLPPGAP